VGEMANPEPDRPLQSFVAGLLRRYTEWAQQNPGTARELEWVLQQLASPPPEGEADLGLVERLYRRLFPPNWLSLTIAAQRRARDVMIETGICLAWVPPADVVRAVIRARTKVERDAALLDNERAILDDVHRVVGEVTDSRLTTARNAAKEAAESYEDGHRRASQALCASAISAVLADHFGVPTFREARRRFGAEHPEGISPRLFRRAHVQWALRMAIALTWSEPRPEGFNRHLTAHSVDPRQFTDAHALAGLMLLTATLRELQELYAVGDNGFPLLASGAAHTGSTVAAADASESVEVARSSDAVDSPSR
jgi:hypothetical protein